MANRLSSLGGRKPLLLPEVAVRLKMSDNAESPTETQKEESQPPSDESTTNEEKKKSKGAAAQYSSVKTRCSVGIF